MCFLLLSPRISHVPLCPAWEWLLFLLSFLLFSPSLCIRVCGVVAYMLCVPHIGVCIVCRGLRLTLGLFLNCSPHWFQRQKGKKKWQLLLLQIQVLSRIITNKISPWHLEAKTLHPVSQVRVRRSFPAVNVLCNVILKIKSCMALHHTPGFPVFFFLRCEPLFPAPFLRALLSNLLLLPRFRGSHWERKIWKSMSELRRDDWASREDASRAAPQGPRLGEVPGESWKSSP